LRSKKTNNLLEQFRRDISRCVRCGACSTVCPSFLADKRESRSPRGRMALIESVLNGKLRVSDVYKDRLATCTGCLACESACASGVPFSRIILAAREQAVRESGPGLVATVVSTALKNPVLMRSFAWLAPVALHYKNGTGRPIHNSKFNIQQGKKQETRGQGEGRRRIAFFPGCAVDQFQPDIGSATVRVLEALNYEVVVPKGLVCCGRPFLSLGDHSAAEELARKNHDILASLDVETVVTSCASCGLTFKKDYPTLLAQSDRDPVRVQDIHEFLAGKTGELDLTATPLKVTWHDPCHLGRGQGLAKTVREVLLAVPGIELVEMKYPDRCCGFGGVMRVSHPTLSSAIGEAKAKDIAATRTEVVVTGCPGCRMQIADSLKRAGSQAEVVHTVQVLANACGAEVRRKK
jgi:glycolate oxidase iron-sulfur subunit